jgi:exodeoxyribonuclease VII small subunit
MSGRSFEDISRELKDIVQKLESGNPTLSEALSLYERGVSLVREANEFLSEAEKRMTIETMDQPK